MCLPVKARLQEVVPFSGLSVRAASLRAPRLGHQGRNLGRVPDVGGCPRNLSNDKGVPKNLPRDPPLRFLDFH